MEFRRYALTLWHWLWLIVLGTAAAAGASYLVSNHQVPVYQASTKMLVNQSKAVIMDSSVLPNADRLAATYADMLRDRPVLEEASRRLQVPVEQKSVTVLPVRNTQLIVLSVEDTSPQRAAAIANEIPKVFIEQNETMQTGRFATSKASLQRQLADTQANINRLQDSLVALRAADKPDPAEVDRQGRDLQSLQASYANLSKTFEDLRIEEAKQLDTLLITAEARPPSIPIRPKTTQNTLLAAVVGAMLAFGLAFLVEYLDDVIKNPDEIEQVLGLTALSVVPAIDEGAGGRELPVLSSTHSAATEAYRVLRTNLQFASVGATLRTLMVTSASPSEGKTRTAANLSATLAQDGKRVILVDTDLHRPRVHRVFKLRNNIGVTTALLAGTADLESLLQETEVPGLRVLSSGPLPPNAAELLGTSQIRELLAGLAALCDIVILDSPPTLALADAAILASRVDGVLLVLDATTTRRELARRAVASLQQVQARLIGAVMNRVPTRGIGSYYYYYYYNHYGHYYNEDGSSRSGRGGRGGGAIGRRLRQAVRGLTGSRRPGHAPIMSADNGRAGDDAPAPQTREARP